VYATTDWRLLSRSEATQDASQSRSVGRKGEGAIFWGIG
jgi:hypothetical protein